MSRAFYRLSGEINGKDIARDDRLLQRQCADAQLSPCKSHNILSKIQADHPLVVFHHALAAFDDRFAVARKLHMGNAAQGGLGDFQLLRELFPCSQFAFRSGAAHTGAVSSFFHDPNLAFPDMPGMFSCPFLIYMRRGGRTMKKKLLQILQILITALGALAFAGGILISPQTAAQGVRDGLTLCGQVVIPSLFPFLALSSFLVQSGLAQRAGHLLGPVTKFAFRLPGAAGSAVFMSLIGGYPVGAHMTAQLLDATLITKKQAQRMLLFCVNSGPAFLISAVGASMLQSRRAGLILCASLTASALLIGIFTHFFAQDEPLKENMQAPQTEPAVTQALVEAAAQGCAGIVSICVWVILFSCIAALLGLLPLPNTLRILLQCLLEVTSGCASAAGSVPLPALAFVLGWGGICVHCQVLRDVSKAGLSLPLFFCARAANGLLACLISAGLFRLFPCEITAFSNHVQALPEAFAASAPVAAGMLFMCALLILEVDACRKKC